ncbi:MAG TPA: FAD binding domain-containing protein [Candidatus Angelobacter sp.]|nr:FAD binding domain-containing protein [Candidatus Angelobacter sp.]
MRYIRAEAVETAASAVAEGAVPLAGGTILVPIIARCERQEQTFVDIGRLAELSRIETTNSALLLGSTVTLDTIARMPATPALRALIQAAKAVGNPQVRRAGTIGGNIAAGVPTADVYPALIAFDAQITSLRGSSSETLSIDKFIPQGRMIVSIQVPNSSEAASAFRKFAWRSSAGITMANVAACLHIRAGTIVASRIVVGGVSAQPQRLSRTEKLLTGRSAIEWNQRLLQEAGTTSAQEAICDLPSPPSPEYRRRLINAGVREALSEILQI